jgi:hypothetical protein
MGNVENEGQKNRVLLSLKALTGHVKDYLAAARIVVEGGNAIGVACLKYMQR